MRVRFKGEVTVTDDPENQSRIEMLAVHYPFTYRDVVRLYEEISDVPAVESLLQTCHACGVSIDEMLATILELKREYND